MGKARQVLHAFRHTTSRPLAATILFCLTSSVFAADKSGVKATAIVLPTGPGSIQGLGESFQPQLNSGTATYTVKLTVPPGRIGVAPHLALSYNSGAPNGPFGIGWTVSTPALQRRTDQRLPLYANHHAGPDVDNDHDGIAEDYEELDAITYSNGEELVPVGGGNYRLKTESEFIRFARDGAGWIANTRDGATMHFGRTQETWIDDGPTRVFRWCLEEIVDTNGNAIHFTWSRLDSGKQRYLTQVRYNPAATGGSMLITFAYEPRPDIVSDYRAGFEIRTGFRCREVTMSAAGVPVRSYRLRYEPITTMTPVSLLASVTEHGRDGTSALPPASFTYTSFDPAQARTHPMPAAPAIALGSNADLLDVNGDGLPDVVDTSSSAHAYFLNEGRDELGRVRWGSRKQMTVHLSKFLSSGDVQLIDVDGDRRCDLLDKFGSRTNVYRVNASANWEYAGTFSDATFNLNDPNVRLLDLNGDGRIDVLMTSGSRVVAWINLRNGRWSSSYVWPSPNAALTFNRRDVKLADMNGDGLQDMVWLASRICVYYPSAGYGRFGAAVTMMNAPSAINADALLLNDVNGDGLADVVSVEGAISFSMNLGTDAANLSRGLLSARHSVTTSVMVTGATAFRQSDLDGNGSVDLLINTYPASGGRPFAAVDFAPSEQPYQLKTISNGIGRVTTLTYGSSTQEMLRDRAAGRDWRVPFPVQIVTHFEVTDGRSSDRYATALTYHDGYYDAAERQFRGFARVEQHEFGDVTRGQPGLESFFEFDVGAAHEALKGKLRSTEARQVAADGGAAFFREWTAWKVRQIAAASDSRDGRVVSFAHPVSTTRDILELGAGTPARTYVEFAHDDYGNLIRQANYGRVRRVSGPYAADDLTLGNDERVITTVFSASYPDAVARWILDRPVTSETTDAAGKRYARSARFYDDETFSTAAGGAITRGNLTMVLEWVDPEKDSDFIHASRKKYDASGNAIRIDDALSGNAPGHFRELRYDPTFSTFPVEETIHTGNADANAPATLRITADYDLGFGKPVLSIDFNGYRTSYRYDAFGRLNAIVKPGDTDALPTVAYSYVLNRSIGAGRINWIETRQREVSGQPGTIDSRAFFDGLGRKIMVRSEGEEQGQIVVAETKTFNARGGVWKDHLAYFENGDLGFNEASDSVPFLERTYDPLARSAVTFQPLVAGEAQRKFSRVTYGPLSETHQDEEQTDVASPHAGASTTLFFDGLPAENHPGRLVEVRDQVRITDHGLVSSPLATWVTRYEYSPLDDLTRSVDAQGNESRSMYDGLKRLVFAHDPDRGYHWFAYDAAGNVARTRDAKGQEIAYSYDGVNRRTAERRCVPAECDGAAPAPYTRWLNAPGPPARAPDVEYHYDLASGLLQTGSPLASAAIPPETVTARNTAGMLSWSSDPSGETHFSYDDRGRTNWAVYRVRRDAPNDLVTVRIGEEHDAFDRITRITYPDRSSVDFTYNARGFAERVTGIIEGRDYNAAGQLASLRLSCGVSSAYAYDTRLRLARLSSTRGSDETLLQDLAYHYDGASNLVQVTDGRSDAMLERIGAEVGLTGAGAREYRASATLSYDDHNRLIGAVNASVFGTISYAYDRIGNMVAASAALLAPDPNVHLGVMAYGGSAGTWNRIGRAAGAAPGPHAFTAATNGGAAGPLLASYDANGNTASLGGVILRWDQRDRLSSAREGNATTGYWYDSEGEKRRRVRSEGAERDEALYFGKFAELRDGKLLNFVYAGTLRVGRIEPTGTRTFYLHDNVGSTVASIDENGRTREVRAYYPYGQTRLAATAAASPTPYLFSGKERESWNGDYFGSRYYSSQLGRFLSVDPGRDINPKEPESWNLYYYTRANPLRSRDEDGEWVGVSMVVNATFIAHDIYTISREGPTAGNLAILAADILLPAGGKLLSGSLFLSKLTARSAHTVELTRSLEKAGHLDEMGKALYWNALNGRGTVYRSIAPTFRGGSYWERIIPHEMTLYRVYGGKATAFGSWWSSTPPSGPLQAVIDSALLPKWGNTAEKLVTRKIPAGTRIFEGIAQSQGGLLGGGNQIYVPQVTGAWPLQMLYHQPKNDNE